jgi:hypothetical protein
VKHQKGARFTVKDEAGTYIWVVAVEDYNDLEDQLERCRSANVYDGHKRVAELEAALRNVCDSWNGRSGKDTWFGNLIHAAEKVLTGMETKGEQPGSNPGHVAEHGRSLVGDAEESRSSSASTLNRGGVK